MDTYRCMNGVVSRSSREDVVKTNARPCNLKYNVKFHCSNSRKHDRYDFQSCNCNQQDDRRIKDDCTYTTIRSGRVIRSTNKLESSPDGSRPLFCSSKYNHGCVIPDNNITTKGKIVPGALSRETLQTKKVWEPMDAWKKCTKSVIPDNNITTKGKIVPGALGRESLQTKKVWEPMDAWKKCTKSSLNHDSTLRNASKINPPEVFECDKDENCCDLPHSAPDGTCSSEFSRNSCEILPLGTQHELEGGMKGSKECDPDTLDDPYNKLGSVTKPNCYSKDDTEEEACPLSDGRYTSTCNGNTPHELPDDVSKCKTKEVPFAVTTTGFPTDISVGASFSREDPINTTTSSCNGRLGIMHVTYI